MAVNTYNFDRGIPCRNPQCKSHGKPHPNCKCSSSGPQTGAAGPIGAANSITQNYAEGGDVQENPCSGAHKADCEYYAGDSELGKLALKNAIMRHTPEDDITGAMLGQSNHEHGIHGLIANMGGSGILGDVQDSPLESPVKNSKLVELANKQLSQKADKLINKISMVSPEKAMHPDFLKEVVRPAVQKMIGKVNPHIVDAVIAAMSKGEISDLGLITKHAKNVSNGHKQIEDAIKSLFSGEGIDQSPSDESRDKLKEFIGQGGLSAQLQDHAGNDQPAQMMAHGGAINANSPDHPVGKVFPEQAMLLGMTKGDVSNYLQQQQPQPDSKLPFDSHHKNSNKHKAYDLALDIANKPLSVLSHVQKGSVLPEHVKHFTGMYPGLHDHLSKKITEKITHAQMADEKPSYRVRQGLSLFLGTALDSTLTPQAIQSVQSIYAPKPQGGTPGAPGKKQSKNTSKLGDLSKDHYTESQAAAKRSTEWD